jgi:hypothetical protein
MAKRLTTFTINENGEFFFQMMRSDFMKGLLQSPEEFLEKEKIPTKVFLHSHMGNLFQILHYSHAKLANTWRPLLLTGFATTIVPLH